MAIHHIISNSGDPIGEDVECNGEKSGASATHPTGLGQRWITLFADKLKLIILVIGYPLVLSTVIKKFGPPEYMDNGPIHNDVGGCQLDLAWPSLGILETSWNKRADILCRDIQVGKKTSLILL
jgi:hypothetical protein